MVENEVQPRPTLAWRIGLFVAIVAIAVTASFGAEVLARRWIPSRLSDEVGRFVMLTISFAGAFVTTSGPFPRASPGRRIFYTLLLGSACAAFGVSITMLLFP
jgi:hypothetical protein